jgi:mono/diheme cytochrome c family protein
MLVKNQPGNQSVRNKLIPVVFAVVVSGLLVEYAPGSTSNVTAATTLANASERTSAALYGKHCASCHGKDGRSKTFKAKFNRARNLTEPGWQDAVSDERIFNSISNGRGGKMPGFAKKLSVGEIDGLVLFVRGLKIS